MKRILALILAVILAFSVISCAPGGNGKEFKLDTKFVLVRSDEMADANVVRAMNYIRDAVKATYGIELSLKDDWHMPGSEVKPNEYEILVGYTNREQSKRTYAALKHNDYKYSIESKNVITICGGNSEATLECAKRFCSDVLGYDGKASSKKDASLKVGTSYTYNGEYRFDTVTLEGRPLESYTVAVRKSNMMISALPLVEALSVYNGTNIPIKTLSELTDEDKNVILLGASDTDGSHIKEWGSSCYYLSSKTEGDRLSVIIDVYNTELYDYVTDKFVSSLASVDRGREIALSLTKNDHIGYDFEDAIPSWTLTEEKTETVADGITYTYQLFTDENGLPYRAYVLKVDPSKAYFYLGTTNDGYAYSLTGVKKQNVLQQINAAIDNGVVPIAGVNGDYFDISGDYHPIGIDIKEGTVISESRSRPWAGYTYDGRFVCGDASLYERYKGQLRTAVGASDVVVKNGIPGSFMSDQTFINTSHPRTLVGIAEDGTVIIAVIDGRRKNLSNGAPLQRCAMFMMSHGALNAVNLDGGGSSCMLVKKDGKYETMNSPSDGSLRRVFCSLLVVPKG